MTTVASTPLAFVPPRGEGRRILHVVDSLEVGGAQQVVVQLTSWLAETGHDVTVLAPEGPMQTRLSRAVRLSPTSARPTLADIARAIEREIPDVVHAHQRREALLSEIATIGWRIPVVEHAHTVLPDRRLRALSFRAQRIYAVGADVRDMVVDHMGRKPERVRQVENIPSVPVLESAPPPMALEPDRPIRLMGAGRLVAQKDPLRFVTVVAELAREHPVEAVWYGDGPLRSSAEDAVRALAAPVRFAATTDSIAAALDGADALLMTSRWEGNPLIALEAQARGKVVLATRASRVRRPPASSEFGVIDDEASAVDVARMVLRAFADPAVLDAHVSEVLADLRERARPDIAFASVAEDYRVLAPR